MNILFLDSIDVPTFGGYERWILLAAHHMAARGHRAIAAGRTGAEYLRRARAFDSDIEILELDISGDFSPSVIWKLRQFLKQNEIDILTVNFNKDVRLGGLAARWYGKTRVVWRLGLDLTRDGFWHRTLSPKLVDGVITCSHALKDQIIRHGYITDEMVTPIHCAIEDKRFIRPDPQAGKRVREKYLLPPDVTVAVTIGRFVDQKGHVHLIDAAPAIVKAFPKIRFLLLGNGPLEPMLRERIELYQLTDYFVFAGMLDDIDLELAGSDFQIHPSIEEPLGHAVLEGMRAGLPVVASRVGGIPEVVLENDSAILVPPADPGALAGGTIELAKGPQQRTEMGLAAQAHWHKNFRLDTMMERFEDYFQLVLDRGRAWT